MAQALLFTLLALRKEGSYEGPVPTQAQHSQLDGKHKKASSETKHGRLNSAVATVLKHRCLNFFAKIPALVIHVHGSDIVGGEGDFLVTTDVDNAAFAGDHLIKTLAAL